MNALERILMRRFGRENRFVGAEIGVHRGKNAQHLLSAFPNLFLWMVDHWSSTKSRWARGRASADWRYQVACDRTQAMALRRRIIRKSSVEASLLAEDASFDFVYIDADHWYEDVKSDIEHWWPKVRRGGLLIGDDYRNEDRYKFGWDVAKAVDEFVEGIPSELSLYKYRLGWIWSVERL